MYDPIQTIEFMCDLNALSGKGEGALFGIVDGKRSSYSITGNILAVSCLSFTSVFIWRRDAGWLSAPQVLRKLRPRRGTRAP